MKSKNGKRKVKLDPKAPGLDAMTRKRRRALADMQRMSSTELFEVAFRAGIYTRSGRLTARYRADARPSRSRKSA